MIRPPRTLALRLTLWYAAIFVLFFGAAFVLFYFSIDSILGYRIDEDLQEDILEFRDLLATEGMARVQQEIEREVMTDDPEDIFLRLYDNNGTEIFSSDLSHWDTREPGTRLLEQLAGDPEPVLLTGRAPDEDYAARIILGRIGPDTILQIGETMEDRQEFMTLLLNIFAVTFIIGVGLAILAGWFMAHQALRGVEEVSRVAVDVASGALNRRVSVKAPGAEIERLADTFNMMLERIRTLITGMREMTDNVAHDLRGPLARIRATAEMTLSDGDSIEEHQAAAADIIEECDRLMHMINTTLDLAEAEAGATRLALEEVDLSRVVEDACELFGPSAEDRGIELSCEIEPGCRIRGNMQLLQRMLANLLDNALKYTGPGKPVNIDVHSADRAILVSVRDAGTGIAEQDQARIFDRFFRSDQSRSETGFGLGLSLARAVARAHGGEIHVSSIPGNGSEFTVTLPV